MSRGPVGDSWLSFRRPALPVLEFIAAISIAESIYALGVIIAGESLLEAKPAVLAVTVGILIVVAVGAGMLLRAQRKRKT
jgi:hypothetical protein